MSTYEEQINNFLEHAGIKGMRWGKRTVKKSTTPIRPRAGTEGKTREQQLVNRAVEQGYTRVVTPALNKVVLNTPKYSMSSDPAVNALLSRVGNQASNRVESEAGSTFMANMPSSYWNHNL